MLGIMRLFVLPAAIGRVLAAMKDSSFGRKNRLVWLKRALGLPVFVMRYLISDRKIGAAMSTMRTYATNGIPFGPQHEVLGELNSARTSSMEIHLILSEIIFLYLDKY